MSESMGVDEKGDTNQTCLAFNVAFFLSKSIMTKTEQEATRTRSQNRYPSCYQPSRKTKNVEYLMTKGHDSTQPYFSLPLRMLRVHCCRFLLNRGARSHVIREVSSCLEGG